jgi:cellobiose-specific phosphotransferase system component IIA
LVYERWCAHGGEAKNGWLEAVSIGRASAHEDARREADRSQADASTAHP